MLDRDRAVPHVYQRLQGGVVQIKLADPPLHLSFSLQSAILMLEPGCVSYGESGCGLTDSSSGDREIWGQLIKTRTNERVSSVFGNRHSSDRRRPGSEHTIAAFS